MSRRILLAALVLFCTSSLVAAKDEPMKASVAAVLAHPDFSRASHFGVTFHFGEDTPAVQRSLGDIRGDRKASMSFGRSADESCYVAMIASLADMAKRAQALGANALINIVSYRHNGPSPAAGGIECRLGQFSVRATLRATMVKLQ